MSRFTGHKYTWSHPFMSTQHRWEFRGPRGGIHFSASIMDDQEKYGEPSCGLEFHRAFDPTNGQEAPHHLDCPVTGGKCWHDGTSLYASEHLWPLIREYLKDGDHSTIFRILEGEYDEHFAQFEKPPSLMDLTGEEEPCDAKESNQADLDHPPAPGETDI